ncbi:hypothetical protein [Streptomyces melanogenes]|uniref:hypothetical protein n=1 Tax=Streptomyces melanogenes TaxID=67326 RepID=UPI00167C87E0|nr:hypothetical protein [Streptomyces melanogenes]GGP86358.1 hypothetical protein GCM10010278_75980 [Streptomyces melanogenes]
MNRPEPAHPAGQHAELGVLNARVAALEAQMGVGPTGRLRACASALLITLACLLAPIGLLAVWTNNLVSDTDRYVRTMAPLASDPAVQQAATDRATDAIMDRVDVAALLRTVSPTDRPKLELALGALTGPLTSGVRELVRRGVQGIVESPQFAALWTQANRVAHTAADKALTGEGGSAVKLTDNAVTIDLGPLMEQAKQRLADQGLTAVAKLPTVHTDFTVLQSKDLAKLRTGFRLLDLAGTWLPVSAGLLAVLGVLLARLRRRALIATALAAAATVAVLGLVVAAARPLYLDRLPVDVSRPAAAAVYDTLTRFLRADVRMLAALGVVVALGAWLGGPGPWAERVRTMWGHGIAAVRRTSGAHTGPAGAWVHRHKNWLTWAVVIAAAFALLLWHYPTTAVIAWLAAGVVLALALLEFLDDGDVTDEFGGEQT